MLSNFLHRPQNSARTADVAGWLGFIPTSQRLEKTRAPMQHFASKWVQITSIQCSHIHLRWKSWNWTKIMYYFTIIVINFGSIFSHFRASINFKISLGDLSNLDLNNFHIGLASSNCLSCTNPKYAIPGANACITDRLFFIYSTIYICIYTTSIYMIMF